MSSAAAADDIDLRLGARIRALRVGQGLTLDSLAQRAEVSRAMLSRIERGESSPTAQFLNRLCAGLGVSLSALFAGAEAVPSPLARLADQPLWRDPESGYRRRSVSPAAAGDGVEIAEILFPPGGAVRFDNRRAPGLAQQVWVLEGALEVTAGEEVFALGAGDCLAMRLDRPTGFRNPGTVPVRYAVIISHGAHRP